MADEHETDEASRLPVIDGPDAEGFYGFTFRHPGFSQLFKRFLCRPEGDRLARVRVVPGPESANIRDAVHGGYLLGFLDQAIFAGPGVLGLLDVGDAVTLGISTQFVATGRLGVPLDCLVEVVRQTRRLVFVTGTMEQDGETVLTYQATMRTFETKQVRRT